MRYFHIKLGERLICLVLVAVGLIESSFIRQRSLKQHFLEALMQNAIAIKNIAINARCFTSRPSPDCFIQSLRFLFILFLLCCFPAGQVFADVHQSDFAYGITLTNDYDPEAGRPPEASSTGLPDSAPPWDAIMADGAQPMHLAQSIPEPPRNLKVGEAVVIPPSPPVLDGEEIDIVYIDPSFSGNVMDGKSPETPYDSWESISFKKGTRYLQKRGTVYNKTISINIDGDAENILYLGAYGEGERPVIDGQNLIRYGIVANGRQYITIEDYIIQNLKLNNESTVGIYLALGANNINVNRVMIRESTTRGIFIAGESENNWAHTITISDCEISNIGLYRDTRASDIGINNYAKDIIVKNSKLYGDGVSKGVDGITLHSVMGSNIVIDNNIIFNHEENEIDFKHHNLIASDEYSVISNNTLYGSKLHSVIQFHFGTNNVIVVNNKISESDGVGVLVSQNPSFTDYPERNFIIAGNLIYNNRLAGIAIGNGTGGNIIIHNNTIVNNGLNNSPTSWGVDVYAPNVRLYNNIIDSNGTGRGTSWAPQIRIGNSDGYISNNNIFVRVNDANRLFLYDGDFRTFLWMQETTANEHLSHEYTKGIDIYENKGASNFNLKNVYRFPSISNTDISTNKNRSGIDLEYPYIGAMQNE